MRFTVFFSFFIFTALFPETTHAAIVQCDGVIVPCDACQLVGFNVKVDRNSIELSERLGVEIKTFNIIYELSEWLHNALKERTPKLEEEKVTGRAKILKHFSTQKNTHVLGGRVEEGTLSLDQHVTILRRDVVIGKGILKNLQQQKSDVKSVTDDEFGMQIDSKHEIAAGDHIEAFEIVIT